jgi:hypothetical protein
MTNRLIIITGQSIGWFRPTDQSATRSKSIDRLIGILKILIYQFSKLQVAQNTKFVLQQPIISII